jgi:hypothetical protein
MKFIAEINFTTEKHCLDCPLRWDEDDSCNLQEIKDFENWEAQMENCPLKPA